MRILHIFMTKVVLRTRTIICIPSNCILFVFHRPPLSNLNAKITILLLYIALWFSPLLPIVNFPPCFLQARSAGIHLRPTKISIQFKLLVGWETWPASGIQPVCMPDAGTRFLFVASILQDGRQVCSSHCRHARLVVPPVDSGLLFFVCLFVCCLLFLFYLLWLWQGYY
jgi:hypothetical protein